MRKKRGLMETLAIAASIIRVEGEIKASYLIQKLESRGISYWTWLKVKGLFFDFEQFSDIRVTKTGETYYAYVKQDSLSTLSLKEKQGMR